MQRHRQTDGQTDATLWSKRDRQYDTIRYDTKEEFNLDSKAE